MQIKIVVIEQDNDDTHALTYDLPAGRSIAAANYILTADASVGNNV